MDPKIVITGGAGFLGSALKEELRLAGFQDSQIFIPRQSQYDLKNLTAAMEALKGAQIVFHLAGLGGGIELNLKEPGKLFYENFALGLNVVEAARIQKVQKLICVGTSCSYPKKSKKLTPENFWEGFPEETSAPYAIAKKALAVMLESYSQQYGLNSVYVIPSNLYGPKDNFDPEASHVIPALIRKFTQAVAEKKNEVILWGDGTPKRDFLFVRDAARGLIEAMKIEKYSIHHLCSKEETSIAELAIIMARITGFQGQIKWDKSKPNGQDRRKLEPTTINFKAQTALEEGLKITTKWWKESR